jgi:hypothetical protein
MAPGTSRGSTIASRRHSSAPANAPRSRADLAGGRRVQQLVAAPRGVGPRGGLLEQGQLGLAGGQGQRPVRAEPGRRDLGPELLPQLPRAQRQVELRAAGPAAHPDQAEVAHRRAARSRLALQVHDVQAAAPGGHRMHQPEGPAPDNHDTVHRPS